jgi:integrase
MKDKITARTVAMLGPKDRPYQVHDIEIPGFIIRVQPSGVMTYLCYYRLRNGRRGRVVIGRSGVLSPTQARDQAREIMARVVQGADPAMERRRAQLHTLAQFLDQKYGPWSETHRKTGDETVRRIKGAFREFLNKNLNELDTWVAEKWRTQQLKAGKKPASVNREIAALKACLSKAVEWGLVTENPLKRLKPLRLDRNGVVRFLSVEEEESLRNALAAREARLRAQRLSFNTWRIERGYRPLPEPACKFSDHLAPMVLVSINTGLRRGELFQLRWEDVDLASPGLTVKGATAKSGTTRHVPLNNEAAHTLIAWHGQSGNPTVGLVFKSENGAKFNNVDKAWAGLLKLAGIESFRWHDLRHHFASRLVMAGVDLNTVRELLGHADLKMTIRYAHLAPAIKVEAVSRLNIARSEICFETASIP